MRQKIIALFFFSLLLIPGIFIFTTASSGVSEYENRSLAKPPHWSLENFLSTDFQKSASQYINDRFPQRSDLIQFYNWSKKTFFRFNPVKDCIVGEQGWLYYGHQVVLDYFTTDPGFSQNELEDVLARQKEKNQELKKLKIPYVIMLAPHKESIYPEFLPGWYHSQVKQKTRHDQLTSALDSRSEPPLLESRSIFLQNKNLENLFFKTDTHWSSKGALLSFLDLYQWLHKNGFKLPPLQDEDFIAKPQNIYGDLSRMLLLPQEKNLESSPEYVLKEQKVFPTNYKVYLITDSFINSIRPYFQMIFKDIKMAALATDETQISSEIRDFKPDLVILLMTERQLLAMPLTKKAW